MQEKLVYVDAFVSVFTEWCFWSMLVMDIHSNNTLITNITEQVSFYIYTIKILPT